jgi:N-acetylmuramoyl-L-alanine amidase
MRMGTVAGWLIWAGCTAPEAKVTPPQMAVFERAATVPEQPGWPESAAGLVVLPDRSCSDPKETVFLMAGHANGRTRNGNTGVHGQIEAEVNLEAALRLGEALEATGCFEVVQGRTGDRRPSYGARIRHAERVGADAFIELHTDARGPIWPWARTPDGWAYQAAGGLGFAVLYNERNHVPGIAEGRRSLARAVTRSLRTANFEPFPAYAGMYEPDEEVGAHIDRRGLKMLREPEVPSIIIETHNAKHFEESLRWREDRVHEAFAAAIADGLVTLFEGPPEPMPCTAPAVVPRPDD